MPMVVSGPAPLTGSGVPVSRNVTGKLALIRKRSNSEPASPT